MSVDIKGIVSNWDIGQVDQIKKVNSPGGKVQSISTLDGKVYYLKEKNSLTEIDKEIQLSKVLSEQGIEIATPLKTRLGKYFVEDLEKYYCLYRALSGKTFQEHFSEGAKDRAFLFGNSIALLHNALSESNLEHLFPEMKLQEQLQDWAIPTILKNNSNHSEFLSIVSELNLEFFPSVNNLPTQIIHRDAHPRNILLKDSQLIGFIDFDIARIGIRLFDLCYCSTSILMSGFSESNNRELWPSLLGELVRGYNSKNRLSSLELRSIIYVIFSIQVIFAAYFYDMDNNDVAQYNLQSLYWLYNNKLLIEAEII